MRLYVVRAPVIRPGSKVLPVVCVALMGVPVWAAPSSAEDVAAAAEAAAEATTPAAPEQPAAVPPAPEQPAPAKGEPTAEDVAVEPGPVEPAPVEPGPDEPAPVEPVPDDVERPDLTVVVGGPASGWPGGEGAYSMTVSNAPGATAAASGFTVFYVPAAGQTVQSVGSPPDSDWACALSTEVSCTWFGELAPAAQTSPVTVVLGHGRRAAGTLTSRVRVSAAEDEVHLADNARTVSTTMQQPELVVAVGAPQSVTPGAPVRVVLGVTNTGPGWASDFSVVGALPDGMQVASISGDGFDCDAATRSCDYTDVLGPGLSAAVAVEAVLAPSYSGGPLTTTARLGRGGTVASAVTAVTALPRVAPPVTAPVTAPAQAPAAAPVRRPARVTPVAVQRRAAPLTTPQRRTGVAATTATTASPATTTAAAAEQAVAAGTPDTLAFTGPRGDDGLAAGVALVLSGLALTLVGRRRRTA
jgi:hypothetical protein